MARGATRRPSIGRRIKDIKNKESQLFSLFRRSDTPSGIQPAFVAGGSSTSEQGGSASSFLPTAGGTMIGPIAFFPKLITIAAGAIDIGKNTDNFSSRIIVSPESGATDDLVTITGAEHNGQLLFLQGIETDTITLKTTGNIETINGSDFNIVDDDIIILQFDVTDNKWQQVTTGKQFLAGGTQTPWLTDIDADGFDLKDLSNLEFRDPTTGAPGPTVNAIYVQPTGMALNIPTANNFEFSLSDVDVLQLDDTFAIFRNTNGVYVLELQNANTGIIDLDQVGELRFKGEKQAGGLETYGRILVNADDVDPASTLDARMTFFVMRDGNSEQFMAFNTTGNNNIDINKRIDMNNNEIDKTAGIFTANDGLDDIGTQTLPYNQINADGLRFANNTTITAAQPMIGLIAGNMTFNVATTQSFDWKVQDVQSMFLTSTVLQLNSPVSLFKMVGGTNEFSIAELGSSLGAQFANSVADIFTFKGTPDTILELIGNGGINANGIEFRSSTLTAADQIARIVWEAHTDTAVDFEAGRIFVENQVPTLATRSGLMRIQVSDNGTENDTFILLNGFFSTIDMFKTVDMNTNNIIDATNIEAKEFRFTTDPTVVNLVMSSLGHTFSMAGTGDNFLIRSGGAIRFNISSTDALFNVPLSQNAPLLMIDASDAYINFNDIVAPDTPSANNIRLFMDSATGKISVKKSDASIVNLETSGGVEEGDSPVTWTGIHSFNGSSTSINSATIILGDQTSDNLSIIARINSSVIPDANTTYDLGSDSLGWRKGFFKSRLQIPVGSNLFD